MWGIESVNTSFIFPQTVVEIDVFLGNTSFFLTSSSWEYNIENSFHVDWIDLENSSV